MMNRSDFKKLTQIRLREARILLKAGCHEGAFYLCGYAVECALKACIAKQTRRYEFPDKKKAIQSHVHDLSDLVKLGGVEQDLFARIQEDSKLQTNWNLVKDWDENSRYRRPSKQEARDLYKATADPEHGVLKWIRQHW